jgi:hypothetical protein
MLQGSRPGERRGGRKRGTPNRRTILRDRILSIGLDHPAASQRALLSKLVKDRKLPADTRMAVAPQSFPPKRRRSSRTGHRPALAGNRASIAQEAAARRCPLSAISRHQLLRRPNDDNESCEQKSNWSPRLMGNSSRDVGESPLHLVRTRAAGNLFPSAIASAAQSSSASRVTAGALGF